MSNLPKFDAARSVAGTALTTSFQDVGVVMASPVLGFVIYNTSDLDAILSFDDGVTTGPTVPASGVFSSSVFNQQQHVQKGSIVLAKAAQVQVKASGAGASGNIILNVVRE